MAEALYTIEIKDQATGRVIFSKNNVPPQVIETLANEYAKVASVAGAVKAAGATVQNILGELGKLRSVLGGG